MGFLVRSLSFRIEVLLFQDQGAEVGVLGAGIEARAIFRYPWEVAMTEDLGIGIVVQQAAEQGLHGVLLSWGTGIVGFAFLIEAAFIADAYRMGVVAAGMSTKFFLWATAVYLTVFRDVEVIADALEASTQMAGLKVFQRKVTRGFRG